MLPKTQEPRWAPSLKAATDACAHCSANAGATGESALKTRSLNANNMVFSFGRLRFLSSLMPCGSLEALAFGRISGVSTSQYRGGDHVDRDDTIVLGACR